MRNLRSVIPAYAGIHNVKHLDARLRGHDKQGRIIIRKAGSMQGFLYDVAGASVTAWNTIPYQAR